MAGLVPRLCNSRRYTQGQRVSCYTHSPIVVMAGLVPATHVFRAKKKFVDARDKPTHDDQYLILASEWTYLELT